MLVPALATVAFVELELGFPDAATGAMEELTLAVPNRTYLFDLALLAGEPRVNGYLRAMLPPVSAMPSKWLSAMRDVLNGRFDDAIATVEGMGARTYAALIRTRAAEHLVVAGRDAEADRHLALALDFWRSVRAQRYIRRAERLLSKVG